MLDVRGDLYIRIIRGQTAHEAHFVPVNSRKHLPFKTHIKKTRVRHSPPNNEKHGLFQTIEERILSGSSMPAILHLLDINGRERCKGRISLDVKCETLDGRKVEKLRS